MQGHDLRTENRKIRFYHFVTSKQFYNILPTLDPSRSNEDKKKSFHYRALIDCRLVLVSAPQTLELHFGLGPLKRKLQSP